MDEPFSHLDKKNAEKAMELILEEVRKRNATVIFADLEQGRYGELCTQHRIRYVTLPPERPLKGSDFPVIYRDKQALTK